MRLFATSSIQYGLEGEKHAKSTIGDIDAFAHIQWGLSTQVAGLKVPIATRVAPAKPGQRA
jgi:hypothetical protein